MQLQQILIGRYQAIAGAWFVNKQCKILPQNESEVLEEHVGALNVYAQKNQLAPTQLSITNAEKCSVWRFIAQV